MTKRWHKAVERGIPPAAAAAGFRLVEPTEVYFRCPDDRYVLYRPDALLVRKRRGYHVVVVEAETNPTAKVIPGDVALASQVWGPDSEIYPYEDSGLGRQMRFDREFRYTYDLRSTELTFDSNGRRLLRGNEIGTLGFLLIVPTTGSKSYFERYVHLLTRPHRGAAPLFSYERCLAVDAWSQRAATAALTRILGTV
jgi:hypothetical protein